MKQLLMNQISELPKNNYNVVSTFSGCGGSSLGYKLSGYNVKCALEFIENAKHTYEINFPNTPVIFKDIRETKGEEILELCGLNVGEIDILDGSPPCCAFSINGAREKNWGKVVNYSSTKQRVDDLFFEYARMVKELRPKVFVAENTKGITLGKAKDVLNEVLHTLREIGYEVDYKVLNASDYGCPQKRERTFVIGVRNDLVEKYDVHPCFPIPLPNRISTKEAIGDLIDKGTDQINHSKREELMGKYFHAGCTSNDIKRICKENNLKVYEQAFRRDKWEEPYYTIKQHHTRPYHPIVDRLMSIDEAKRIQTFPDDFKLVHSPTQNWERIGRSVPPNLMKEISKCIQVNILDKIVVIDKEK